MRRCGRCRGRSANFKGFHRAGIRNYHDELVLVEYNGRVNLIPIRTIDCICNHNYSPFSKKVIRAVRLMVRVALRRPPAMRSWRAAHFYTDTADYVRAAHFYTEHFVRESYFACYSERVQVFE